MLNSAGAEVATGIAGASKRHELPPGDYTLVVTAGEETLKAPIAVALRKDETVTVVVKDDRLAIE